MEAEYLKKCILDCGADEVGIVAVQDAFFLPEFREICQGNSCGMYGRCWMCPPAIGTVETLIAQAKQYRWAAVYQTVGVIEDSFDFDAMMNAGRQINYLAARIRHKLRDQPLHRPLYLGAGGSAESNGQAAGPVGRDLF